MNRGLSFKIATEDWEFEQIHALNYKTFVQEIPQHGVNKEKKLVDKFHEENSYCICLRGRKLLGMLACRSKRPFSLDLKLADLAAYLPPHNALCEIRLLSVEKEVRGGRILVGLMNMLMEYCNEQGYDLAVISGTVRQLKLYQHLGFAPFGPLVGKPEAMFQPMYLARETIVQNMNSFLEQQPRLKPAVKDSVNFLPGPVRICEAVKEAFIKTPVSHRSDRFLKDIAQIQHKLSQLVNSKSVQILLGSGTLANDVVAANLSNKGKGIVVSNGEFGERLVDHAQRARLDFKEFKNTWGKAIYYDELEIILDQEPSIKWVWAVHLETSTGVLNDLSKLKDICKKRNIILCLDCVSSIGALSIDLKGVFLASGVSGKALCSYPGLSFVFYNHTLSGQGLPRYMDLELYSKSEGVPFTHSSNFIYALQNALNLTLSRDFSINAKFAEGLRRQLRALGIKVIAAEEYASPNVISFELPRDFSSETIGARLENEGYYLSYRSSYLLKRNWLQVCLMGEYDQRDIEAFPSILASCLDMEEDGILKAK
ncbi:aminotransferase class V-fold PLP-dependent enzyme [Desulfosporosinus sp.]|uniref:aminotransferase class V-fold PLP-dependent enzyme n=1 Tax=Desulfosporosinus sp. TaxID=157907 RepID=UPI0023136454|nr:aminotransferase class V-fold PLP-dependent enzyme [Desulfosporosinus sp.]MDA8223024.1 aminotransferase class V-fold PLP-dependent enzyme [Desulfitobacterium hafniense]